MDKKTIQRPKEVPAYKNDLAAPRVSKIVVNIGVGRLSGQPNFEEKILPEIVKEISLVTGQKPVYAKAKKSIAGFKIRAGQIVGLKATLRHGRMHDFLQKLIRVVLPRVRDFRGVNLASVDKTGNLHIGLKDVSVFPEISADELKIDFGLEISIVSTAKSREGAIQLYRVLGIPLKK